MTATKTADIKIETTPANRRALIAEGKVLKSTLRAAMVAKEVAAALLAETRPADIGRNASDEDSEIYCNAYEAAATAAGYYPANEAVWAAELALIAWAEKVMKAHYPKKFALVTVVFEKGPRNLTLRPKLVDLCIKLEG